MERMTNEESKNLKKVCANLKKILGFTHEGPYKVVHLYPVFDENYNIVDTDKQEEIVPNAEAAIERMILHIGEVEVYPATGELLADT